MPTKLPQANGSENHVSVSEGSEQVVHIKRLSQRPAHEPNQTVDHEYNNAADSREFLRDEDYTRSQSRREAQPRRGTPVGASLFQEIDRKKRVTSILEVNAPQISDNQTNRATATIFTRQQDLDTAEVVESEDETRIIDSFLSETKSYKEVRSRKHASERSDLENSSIRYSKIFVPELSRKYKNRRVPWRHRSSGRVYKAANAIPCNCQPDVANTQHLCRRCCSSMSLNELKAPIRDKSIYPQPDFACSMESLHHHHHHHHHQHSSRHREPAHRCSSCNRNQIPAEQRRFLHNYSIDTLPRRMYSSDAIHELHASNTILNRNADLLEIEYEKALDAQDEESEAFLTPHKLKLITKLASECVTPEENDLDKAARTLKLALDERFGKKWQVVVGNDTYGSNVSTLPGALVNFKLDKNVILAWRT